MVNSTLSGNSAGDAGGGIFNNDGGTGGNSKVTLINCTLSGNSAGSRGGGVSNGALGGGTTMLTLLSSTISSNSAPSSSGIRNIGILNIGNTILNGGISGSNISSPFGTFKLNDGSGYILMYDMYTSGRYQFTRTTDLQHFTVIDDGVSMDFHPRHGTVIPITAAEAKRLAEKWQ